MAKSAGVSMELGGDGVALITISNPPVNALSHLVISGVKQKYAEAMNCRDVKAVVFTGDSGKFSGGFDISLLHEVQKTGDLSLLPDVSIELVLKTIEDGKKPSVAAITGIALGGGLELAMGCHARVATPNALLGLPELSLGLIPGFGGTKISSFALFKTIIEIFPLRNRFFALKAPSGFPGWSGYKKP